MMKREAVKRKSEAWRSAERRRSEDAVRIMYLKVNKFNEAVEWKHKIHQY